MVALKTPPALTGWKAPTFSLKGTDGRCYGLDDVKGSKGLLVMFICNHCPFVKAIADKLTRDMRELTSIGIGSVAIMSNNIDEYPEDSFENMIDFKKKYDFPFPYLIDESQAVARDYGAVCTPDFFGFDANLTLLYRGRLDSSGMNRTEAGKRELFEAMKQVATTGQAPAEQKPSIGCSIKWRTSISPL